MNSIDTQSAAARALGELGATNGLTSESLMFWLSTKLDAMDTDINALLDEQTSALKQKEALQQYKHMVSLQKERCAQGDKAGADQALHDWWAYGATLPLGSPERAVYDQKHAEYNSQVAGKTGAELDVEIQQTNGEIEELDKNSELKMIRINQLMSQRQTAVQLAQAIMNKHNETIEGIVQKIS